jgi:methionine-rich copper-binding protein CopC
MAPMLPRISAVAPRRVVAVAIVVGVALGALAARPVEAHSDLIAASPGPGATVGGSITDITLQYDRLVVEFDGRVTDPEGVDVASTSAIESGSTVTISLASPLSTPGEYAVRHEILSEDGDRVESAYLFTFDPASPPPQFIEVESGSRGSGLMWVVAAVGLAVSAGLTWRRVDALRRAKTRRGRRRLADSPGDVVAAVVRVGLDLEGGMGDVVRAREQFAGLVEDAVAVGAGTDHQVGGHGVHLRRQRPHVEVVDVDDALDVTEVGGERVEVDVVGC